MTGPKATDKDGRVEEALGTMRVLVVYGAIGLVGTLAHYVILLVLVELAGVGSVASSSAGFIVGALINHELNRSILFHRTLRSRAESRIRFLSTAVVGFFINLALMAALVPIGVHYVLAQLLATGLVFLVTFVINRRWTFGV